MSFQEKIRPMIASIRNELARIEMNFTTNELGGPDYDTIDYLTDLIEGKLEDIRERINEHQEEATP